MKAQPEVEICIVGLGAVGAMAAHALATAGLEVVALEAGPTRTGSDYRMDELASSAGRNAWGDTKFNREVPTWRRNLDSPRRETPRSQGMANGVGGSSLAYAGISFRYHPDDFRVRSNTLSRYGPRALPSGTDITDWPLRYEDLEPYYDLAEELLGVSGQAGNVRGTLLPGGNPFEGPRERPYPLPPLRTSGVGELFATAAREAGYQPFPVPAAILSEPYDGRPACTYCSFCTRSGCHVGAKASALVTVLPRALATGRLKIRTGCRVLRVRTTERGDTTGVEYIGPDGLTVQPAKVVILASYTFENVRLLLLSRGPRCPNGLGNSASQVGCYYMARQHLPAFGVFTGRRLNCFIGSSAQGQTIDDLNADNFDHAGLGFLRGGRISAVNQFSPITSTAIVPPDLPRWGRAYKEFLARCYNSTVMLTVSVETLPYEANFLDLDPDVRDPHGVPVVRITFDNYDNEHRALAFLQERAVHLLQIMGADRIWRATPSVEAISVHDVGGTRMGTDPGRSVVDSFGRLHDVPNVFVLGGSTFPTQSGLNPTLTMQALALRSAFHIAHTDYETMRGKLRPGSSPAAAVRSRT